MANREQQVQNSFIYLLPVIVGNILPLVTLPIYTRILTKEDFGVLALSQMYAVFVGGLANFGMTVVYDRNYFQYRERDLEAAKLLYSILLFVLLNFLLLAGLTYLFKERLAKLIIGSSEHGNILFWSFCAQLFLSLDAYYLAYFKNSEKAKSFAVYTIAISFLNTVISVFLVVYLRIGVLGMVYAQVCSAAVILGLLGYRFTAVLAPSLSKSILMESLKIGYPLTPLVFFGVIGSQFDKYMVGLLASLGGVGIYSIGQSIAYVVFTYMTAIQNVFSPQVYQRMFDLGDTARESVGRYLTPFCYASIFLGLLIALFSEEIVFVITPSSYHGAIDIVIILSMLYGSYFFAKQPQLIFAKKTHITSLLSIVTIGLNIAVNIPFIIRWGAIGAAWGTLTAGIISGIVTFIVSQHYYEIRWEYRKVGVIYLIFFGSSVAMILLRSAETGYWLRLVLKFAMLSFYLYSGVKFGLLSRKNFALLKEIVHFSEIPRLFSTKSAL